MEILRGDLDRKSTHHSWVIMETSNNFNSYQRSALGAIWGTTVASGIFLGLRVYCKTARQRGLWWDDYILILSWVGTYFLLLTSTSLKSIFADQEINGKAVLAYSYRDRDGYDLPRHWPACLRGGPREPV